MEDMYEDAPVTPRLVSGILIMDGDGRAIHISDSLCKALRLGENVQGIPLEKLGLGPTATVELSRAINKAITSMKPTSTVLSIMAGGIRMWGCELYPSLLDGSMVDSVTIILTDVTPTRSESMMDRLPSVADVITNALGLFMVLNADTLEVRFVNSIGRELLRQSNLELTGRSLLEIIPQSSELYRSIRMAKQSLQLQFFNVYAGKRTDDKDLYLRVAIFPFKENRELVITVSDATTVIEDRLKVLTEDLATAHSHIESILAVLPVGVLIIDPDGVVIEENQAIRSIWRRSLDHSHEDAKNALEDHDIVRLSKMVSDQLGRGIALTGQREVIHRADGTTGTILLSAVQLRKKVSRKGDFVAVVQDITDIATLEAELKRGSEILARSNAELQQFAYVASHDLQEPLRMVTSYLDLLCHKYGEQLDPRAKEYMSYAVDGADRMRELINDLLSYSRVDSRPMKMEEIDLNKTVSEVVQDLHIAIGKANADVIVNTLPVVVADKIRMKQVVQNLLSNAIKFHGEAPPRIEISARRRGSEWVISVKDNGIGIDEKYNERVFEMFQRLHAREEYEGTGIGLAIAKKVVERHGGKIWFESTPGEGSTFFFTIPVNVT